MPDLSKKIAFLFLFLTTVIPVSAQRLTRAQYIERYKDIAVRQMLSNGIPASIILAQACLESANGNSRLAVEANNHFGIKCHNWTGETILHDDDLKSECFRKYPSPEDSFTDHSHFLRFRERYRFLFDLDPLDYRAWAHGLKRAGYATDPNYAQLLIKIIEENELYRFDLGPGELPPSPALIIDDKELDLKYLGDVYSFTLSRRHYKKNGVRYIIAQERDTYKSLAKEYNLFTREILGFNDLKKEIPIKEGTVVYLERKRDRGDKGLSGHICEPGETMYIISQKYGIRLDRLYKLNSMKPGEEPREGFQIKLR